MDDFSTLGELVLEIAVRHGWEIVDLNDNPQGLRVKGASWRATHNGEKALVAWRREGLAEPLAEWMLGRRTLYMVEGD